MGANGRFRHVAVAIALAAGLMGGCSSSNDPAPIVTPPPVITPPPPPPPLPPPPTTVVGTIKSGAVNLDQYSTVSLAPAGGGNVINIMAASNGSYSATVAAGTYSVAVKRPGYAPYTQATFAVTAAQANTLNVSLNALPAMTYITSADCGVCHSAHYASFRQTGHPYKLSKVTGNAPPVIPFNDLSGVLARLSGAKNTLGTPAAWTDVSYVIGGFSWKTRFIDKNGYVVTGTAVQQNVVNNAIVGYNSSIVDEPYDCGNCHNTGWRAYDATLNPNRQDNLPGMQGTWAEPGVQCEACHGAGSKHAQTRQRQDITLLAQPRTPAELKAANAGYGLPIACGECHMREGERKAPTYESAFDTLRLAAGEPLPAMGGRIRASGGLMQHRVTWEETLGVDPDDAQLKSTRSQAYLTTHGYCGSCHNPHGSTVARNKAGYTGQPGVDSSKQACLSCHPLYDPARRNQLGMQDLNCIDCHMPKMLRNATDTPASGDKPKLGDERSHLFRIRLPSSFKQFNTAGNIAYPWITPAYACATCHDGVTLFPVRAVITDTYRYHDNT